MESQSPAPRLLDQVRSFMRLHHYSIHTERTDRQTALRQRIANPGSHPAARQRPGLQMRQVMCSSAIFLDPKYRNFLPSDLRTNLRCVEQKLWSAAASEARRRFGLRGSSLEMDAAQT